MRHWLAAIVICGALALVVGATSAQGQMPWEKYQAQQPPKPNPFEQFRTKKTQAQQTPKPNVYEQFGDNPSNLPNRYSIYSAVVGIGGGNNQVEFLTMILLDGQTGQTWMLVHPQGQGATWTPVPYVGGAPK